MAELEDGRRPLCKPCLDWSAWRSHLAGGLGVVLLERILERGSARRDAGKCVFRFSGNGERQFQDAFPV